jgi:MYXO-CTERM domain-containing protein
MRLRFSRTLAPFLAVGAAALAMAPAPARAYDVLAHPCATTPLTCGIGAVSFSRVDALPIQFNFDTGWVPAGSPVQVHLFADVWANTHVSLTGALQTSWPETLTLAAPGDPVDVLAMKGGDFGFHYGADFGAQGKVSISVAGQNFSWQGDLPYVPQFDLDVDADQVFDAWGYSPGVTVSSTTMPQQIASIDVSTLIGASIPGIDGGFALDVAVELDATYTTERVVIDTTDGLPVAGGPITAPDGTTTVPFHNGANIELDVHPEGTVAYDGVVHLIPTFWVSLLGDKFDIPIVDIPIGFPITTNDWTFTPQRVHVPLPDLALSVQALDFGEVQVGDKKALQYQLWNAGEAKAAAVMTTSDALTFPLLDESSTLAMSKTFLAGVEFIPQTGGTFVGQIAVASNDPKSPVQLIVLKGVGIPTAAPPAPPPTEGAAVSEPSSCGCRTAGDGGTSGLAGLGAVIAAMAMVRRRRRG